MTTASQLGGIETYCIEMAKALNNLGHTVTLISGEGEGRHIHGIKYVKLFHFTPRKKFPDLGNRFRKLMERLSFGRNSFSHLLRQNYDAILITKPYDFPVVWLLKKFGYNGQIIFHTGGTDFFLGDRFFSSAVDIFIACSQYTSMKNESHFTHQFHTIPNGVDTDVFKPGSKDRTWLENYKIPQNAKVIMTVGRIVGWKGLGTIIKAIADLPNVHYICVGKGPYERELRKIANELAISHRIHAIGAIPHDQIPMVMKQTDLFAQPSVGEEAFGITLIEAMACGLPVLASAQGGMLEIITHEQDGLLLPPNDIKAWQGAIERLIQDSTLSKNLGKAARETVTHKFTWNASAISLEKLITGDPAEHISTRNV